MPGLVSPVHSERENLLGFLEQARYTLKLTAHGLTDAQARATPSASPLSVGGLIKHVAATERSWISTVLELPTMGEESYVDTFTLADGETLAGVVATYDEVAARTTQVIAGIADLDQPVPVPRGVPWFPADVDAWSVRWVLAHLIQETARHTGHADIVRESIDGATAFPLMAAAEQWPATPWMQPWSAA